MQYTSDVVLNDCSQIRYQTSSNFKTNSSTSNRNSRSSSIKCLYENKANSVKRQNYKATKIKTAAVIQQVIDSVNSVTFSRHFIKHVLAISFPMYYGGGPFKCFRFYAKDKKVSFNSYVISWAQNICCGISGSSCVIFKTVVGKEVSTLGFFNTHDNGMRQTVAAKAMPFSPALL